MNKIKLIKKFQEPDGAIEQQVTQEQNDKKDSNKKTRKQFKQLETDFVSLVPKDHPAKDAYVGAAEWFNDPTTQALWQQNVIDALDTDWDAIVGEKEQLLKNLDANSPEYTDQKVLLESVKKQRDVYNEKTSPEGVVNDIQSRLKTGFNLPFYVRNPLPKNRWTNFNRPIYWHFNKNTPSVSGLNDKWSYQEKQLKSGFTDFISDGTTLAEIYSGKPHLVAYRNHSAWRRHPLHEGVGHGGVAGVKKYDEYGNLITDAMSAPAEWLESILRETGEYKDNYYDNGSEAYSRLLDVRHYNKLNPKKRNWTEKSVKKLIKKSAKKQSDYNDYQQNFLNRYKPSTIARIFNEVAQANPSNLDVENAEQLYGFDPTDGIGYVKQGAKITSKVKKFQNSSGPLRSKMV